MKFNDTQTLDTCTWIQHLHNKCEEIDVLEEIKSLSKPMK